MPCRHVLVDLHALARDDAGLWRDDLRVAQVQIRLVKLRLRLLPLAPAPAWHAPIAPLPAAARSERTCIAPGPALPCHAQPGQPSAAARSLACASVNRCLRRIRRGHGRVELLLADDVLLDQRLVTLQVRLRLGVVGLRLDYPRVCRLLAAAAPAKPMPCAPLTSDPAELRLLPVLMVVIGTFTLAAAAAASALASAAFAFSTATW